MPRRRSRKQTNSTGTAIALTFKAIAAAIGALTLAIVAYYKWASKITDSKRKIAAYLAPVGLVGVVSIIGLAAPSEQATETKPQTTYQYNPDVKSTDVAKADPVEEVEPESANVTEADLAEGIEPEMVIEPEPYVEPESYTEPEPHVTPTPVNTGVGYIDGSCKELKAQGLGPFYPGDANYTSKRDGDDDGVACE